MNITLSYTHEKKISCLQQSLLAYIDIVISEHCKQILTMYLSFKLSKDSKSVLIIAGDGDGE